MTEVHAVRSMASVISCPIASKRLRMTLNVIGSKSRALALAGARAMTVISVTDRLARFCARLNFYVNDLNWPAAGRGRPARAAAGNGGEVDGRTSAEARRGEPCAHRRGGARDA